ncbi:hypothetical protein [Demequina sp.]|uniref:hypothetical protein n=1 Tax=Demequina sp. TaxID=2050685 RepID=UPI0025FC08B5|nr:hypothetical protein [Demequina sp.]
MEPQRRMDPRPRPLLGMLLGLLIGAVGVALLWQTGVIDPGRLVSFLVVAVATLAVTGLLTRSIAAARGRFVTVAVISGILAGVALTGIPEIVRSGAVSDGCTVEATVGDATVTPGDTSAFSPLDLAPDATVSWSAASDSPVVVTERVGGIIVAGFAIPIRTVTVTGASEVQELAGTVDVAEGLAYIKDTTGLDVSGVYHAYGSISGESAACELDGWVLVAPESAFSTNTLKGLWVALGLLLVAIAWAALAVRKSFVDAAAARAEAGKVYDGSVTSGAAAVGTGGAYAAPDAAPSGATTSEPQQEATPEPEPGAVSEPDATPEPEPEPAPESDDGPEPASEDEDSDPRP